MFLHPFGLLALLGVPSVVALHLFRRRFRPEEVSALFLWQVRDRTSLAGRRRERLRNSASLWLELCVALCLGLMFASPRSCAARDAEHLVCVLDSSASMSARGPEGVFAELALAELTSVIEALPGRSRVSVLASGTHPRLIAGPAALPAEALEALADWRPRSPRHALGAALDLAQELVSGGRVLLLTDRDVSDSLGAEVELRALGIPSSNVGIVNASRNRDVDDEGAPSERVFLTIANASDRAQRRLLRITVGDNELARQQLELAADARQHLSFLLPLGAPALLAELEHDQLELDDEAWLAPLAPRTLALSSELPTSELRMLGLSQEPGDLERWLALVPESLEASGPSLAHLAIGDGTRGVDERRWEFSLVARGSERSDLIGPFLSDKRHPLLAGLTLEGIVWSIQPGLVLPGAPLVSAGNTPILTEERIDGGRRFHLNLDPERSSLQRSPDWPILLSNLAELRRRELPGPERTSLALGEPLILRGSPGVQEYVLIGPDSERAIEATGTLVIDELDAPGLYQLEQNGTPIASFGVSFLDAAESDLRRLATAQRASDAKAGQLAAGASGLQLALLAIALVAWALDWFVLRPRQGGAA